MKRPLCFVRACVTASVLAALLPSWAGAGDAAPMPDSPTAAAAAPARPAAPAPAAPPAAPGYFDFAALDRVYGEPRVMINISPMLLKIMAAASQSEPEAAQLMESLEGVRVNIYPTGGQQGPARAQIAKATSALQAENWEPVVQVKEDGEEVQIFMKADDTGMQGLTVMAVDGEEAVFLNILGDIDPSQLGKVMKQLDVDVDVGDLP